MAGSFYAKNRQASSASAEEGGGTSSPSPGLWEAHGRSDFAYQDPLPPVPQPGSGGSGTSSRALPAMARNKKEPRRVTHIPGISKVKDKVQDAWHNQEELKDKSKKVIQEAITSLCSGNKDDKK